MSPCQAFILFIGKLPFANYLVVGKVVRNIVVVFVGIRGVSTNYSPFRGTTERRNMSGRPLRFFGLAIARSFLNSQCSGISPNHGTPESLYLG